MHGRKKRSAGSVLPGWGLSESQHCSPTLGCSLLGWLSQCDTWPCPVIYHGNGRLVKTGFILFPWKSTVGCLSEYLLSPARACSRVACSPTAFLGMWDADIPYSRLPSQPHPFPSPVSMMEGLTLEALGLKNLCSDEQKRQFWGESWIFPSAVCITGDQWKTKCACLHVLHSLQPPACMPSSSRTDTIWLRLEVFVPGFSFYFPSFISSFLFWIRERFCPQHFTNSEEGSREILTLKLQCVAFDCELAVVLVRKCCQSWSGSRTESGKQTPVN